VKALLENDDDQKEGGLRRLSSIAPSTTGSAADHKSDGEKEEEQRVGDGESGGQNVMASVLSSAYAPYSPQIIQRRATRRRLSKITMTTTPATTPCLKKTKIPWLPCADA
jgi:hypothetical protein